MYIALTPSIVNIKSEVQSNWGNNYSLRYFEQVKTLWMANRIHLLSKERCTRLSSARQHHSPFQTDTSTWKIHMSGQDSFLYCVQVPKEGIWTQLLRSGREGLPECVLDHTEIEHCFVESVNSMRARSWVWGTILQLGWEVPWITRQARQTTS